MDNIWLVIIALAAGLVAVFLVPVLLELRRTIITVRTTIEGNLNPALAELQKNLTTLNSVTGNVEAVTADIRRLSSAVGEMGKTVSAVNAAVAGTGASMGIRLLSLRTGVTAAVGFILTNMMRKGERK